PATRPDRRSCPTRRSSDLRGRWIRAGSIEAREENRGCACLRHERLHATHDLRVARRDVLLLARIRRQIVQLERLTGGIEHVQSKDRKSTRLNSSHVKISYA